MVLVVFYCSKKTPEIILANITLQQMWITGSNRCQTLLCAFYHLRIVLITEAIVHLQKQMAKYTRKPKNDVNVISSFPFMVSLGLWNSIMVRTISLMLLCSALRRL